jgi:glutathione S-transferase
MARSIAAEMHSGFTALRSELPLDCRRQPAAKPISAAAADDIARIRTIWREARTRHGTDGPWLFGRFGIIDAMYAPVALRFHSYAVALDGAEAAYVETVLAHPAVIEWVAAA